MKQLFALLAAGLALAAVIAAGCGKPHVTINGAGATFPYPVYAKWADTYAHIAGVRVNYQPIGSGGGVQQIKARTVDFGASDAPLTTKELDGSGLTQFPMVMGGVVPVVNLPGIKPGEIRLSPDVLAGIFLGSITRWNDPKLARDNPGAKLPNKAITVVHRSDGSGTTWIFTNYLDKVSKEWHERVGFDKAVAWPVGDGGKGNEGVASYVQRTDGAIGYVEYAYAVQSKMTYVKLKNKAGSYVEPSISTFQSAAINADWANVPGFYVILTDQPGADSWPITGASYIIIHKAQKDPTFARAMLRFFDWSYRSGADEAKKLDYVPMPESVVKLVQQRWKTEITTAGKPVWK